MCIKTLTHFLPIQAALSRKKHFFASIVQLAKKVIWLVTSAWLSVHINFNFLCEEGIRQKRDFENLYSVSTFNTNDVNAWKLPDSTQRVWAPMCKSFGSNFHLKSNKLAWNYLRQTQNNGAAVKEFIVCERTQYPGNISPYVLNIP